MPVTVQRATKQRIPISLEAVGQAEGSREVEVRARVSGIVERRAYQEGAPVKAGDLLFTIDRAPYELAVTQARAALTQERVRQEQARRESARLKPLVEEKAISRREFDEATSTFEQATAAIAGAQARLSEAELNLSYTKVTAPISGVTGRALRSEGSLVTANTESSLLTTMTQVDPVWIRFSLAESDYESIRGAERQARVKIMKQDGSSAAENGRLNFTGQTVDPKLGTVQLRAEFANPGLKWLPGQFVKVQILAGTQEAYLVPQAAVMQTEQGRLVWIVGADGKAAMRPIANRRIDRQRLAGDERAAGRRPGDRRQPDEGSSRCAGSTGPPGRAGPESACRAWHCAGQERIGQARRAGGALRSPMGNFSRFFIERPIFASVLAILITLAGLIASTRLAGRPSIPRSRRPRSRSPRATPAPAPRPSPAPSPRRSRSSSRARRA